MRQSIGLSPAAATWTRSSPAPGVGRGISPTDNFSGGPYSANVAASKLNPPPPNDLAQQRRGSGELEVPETIHAPPSAAAPGSVSGASLFGETRWNGGTGPD